MSLIFIIPWSLLALRVLLGPLIVYGARHRWDGIWLSLVVAIALLSDIYDGVLARRWSCETTRLRISDSIADTIFYLGVVWALWIHQPHVLRANLQFFFILFGLEGFRYLFDLWKFHRTASYHSYFAKAWGLLIAISVIAVFSSHQLEVLIRIAVLFGIAVNCEGIIMSLMLPQWKNDVKTLRHAWTLRRHMLSSSGM